MEIIKGLFQIAKSTPTDLPCDGEMGLLLAVTSTHRQTPATGITNVDVSRPRCGITWEQQVQGTQTREKFWEGHLDGDREVQVKYETSYETVT